MSSRTVRYAQIYKHKSVCALNTQKKPTIKWNDSNYNNFPQQIRYTHSFSRNVSQNQPSKRGFSQLKIHSNIIKPPTSASVESKPPTLIIHGLFGSSSNWRGIAKKISDICHTEMHLLDMRNHGESPHSNEMNYDAMVRDVLQYLRDKGHKTAQVIGHSMGGRVAMKLAVDYPSVVEKLVVVDVAPVTYPSFDKFNDYIEYMKSMDLPNIRSRRDADEHLSKYIPQYGLRQFLLTNLRDSTVNPKESGNPATTDSSFTWRINLDALQQSLPSLRKFNHPKGNYSGNTLFIGGAQSNYIIPSYHDTMNSLFPNNTVTMLDGAGHWVHADRPDLFVKEVSSFLCAQHKQ